MISRSRALGALGAGLALAPSVVRAQAPTTIKVSTLPIDSGAEVFYARENGFFSRAGLDVQVFTVSNGGASASAVAGGGADIGYADTVSLALGHGKGIPFTIVAPAALHVSAAPTTLLMVADGSPLRTGKDFEGKVIAGSGLTTISGFSPRAWIDASGGDSTKSKFIELAFPAMAPALDAGRIDGAMIAEPFLAAARKTHRSLGCPYDAVAREFIISAYFTTTSWAKDHPDVLARFVNAIHEAATWANTNHPKSAEILTTAAKVDPALVAAMTRARYAEQLTTALMQPVVNVASKYGGIAAFPAQELFYSAGR